MPSLSFILFSAELAFILADGNCGKNVCGGVTGNSPFFSRSQQQRHEVRDFQTPYSFNSCLFIFGV